MPNSATLVQALGAAFCAILCALSGMGGGGMMIGARTAAWAKSGYTAKDYVQDGLIAMWDGIENAGFAADGFEHDSNATVWRDLSGNGNDLSLVSGEYEWNSDAFRCLAKNCASAHLGRGIYQDVRTVEVGFRLDSSAPVGSPETNFQECVAVFGNPRNFSRLMLAWDDRVSITPYGSIIFSPNNLQNSSVNLGTRFEIDDLVGKALAITFVGEMISGTGKPSLTIVNGVESSTIGNSDLTGAGQVEFCIGGQAISSNYRLFRGRVHWMRLYSVLLSAEKVGANYAVDKARFGLT